MPFSYYVEMCRAIREACPRIHIKAFTAVEIVHFTRISRPRLSIRDVLKQLRAAGLDEVPMVYKDINEVMAAQSDLVQPVARFTPRLVKMAPAGGRPED